MAKKKYKRKTWWDKHWDEAMLISGLSVALYFFLRGMGAI